jgi:hypothetical protein
VTYDPLTDDLLVAIEAAQERSRCCRQDEGHRLSLLLSGFDLNPVLMAELVDDQGKSHAKRLEAGAKPAVVLQSSFVSGLLIGLMVGQVREAREIAAGAAE